MIDLTAGQNIALPAGPLTIGVGVEPADRGDQFQVVAFALDPAGQAADLARMIHEGNTAAVGGAVRFDAAKEVIRIDAPALPADVARISVVLAVRGGPPSGRTMSALGAIEASVRDDAGQPIARFRIPTAGRPETCLTLVEVYRHGAGWKVRAVAQGYVWGLPRLARSLGLDLPDPARPDPAPRGPEPGWSDRGERRGGERHGGGRLCTGTGFCVHPDGYFVTNHHVVDDARTITAVSPQGRHPVEVVFADPANDLALLRAPVAWPRYAALRSWPQARLGETVMAVGYPLTGLLGSSAQVTMGNVSGLSGLRGDTCQLQMTAPVQRGNSGGPLIDRDGLVAGVVVSKLDAARIFAETGDIPQNVNFAIKAAVLAAFLEAAGVPATLQAPAGGSKDAAELAAEATAYTVRIECTE